MNQTDWVWIETAEGERLLYRMLMIGANRPPADDADWRATGPEARP